MLGFVSSLCIILSLGPWLPLIVQILLAASPHEFSWWEWTYGFSLHTTLSTTSQPEFSHSGWVLEGHGLPSFLSLLRALSTCQISDLHK